MIVAQGNSARLQQAAKRFWRDRHGATAIEYAVLAGLVSVGIVVGAMALGGSLDQLYVAFGTQPALNK